MGNRFGEESSIRDNTIHRVISVAVPFRKQQASSNEAPCDLKLMMLGFDDSPPYGPIEATAEMYVELLSEAQRQANSIPSHQQEQQQERTMSVSITTYNAKRFQYPKTAAEWDSYDGVIIPGASHCTYSEPWIRHLVQVIRHCIHPQHRKTLAVCFGHHIYALALNGSVAQSLSGSYAGPLHWNCTRLGQAILQRKSIHMLSTYSNVVTALPSCADSLGSSPDVPVAAAVYYSDNSNNTSHLHQNYYAFTFHAHPEYAASPCGNRIYQDVFKRINISPKLSFARPTHQSIPIQSYNSNIYNDSIHSVMQVGKKLGWF